MLEINKNTTIGVVGLGYVGLPLAISFAKKFRVIGYDFNEEKISKYKVGIDITNEVGDEVLKKSTIEFTTDSNKLNLCNFIIVAVPTPIDDSNKPDTKPLEEASKVVGMNMQKGCIVIYESTVYPGLTEEICMPILEENSNKKCGKDFKIAYSPERINPGDKQNTFENITKIVSGMDTETLNIVSDLYLSVLKNGVYKASSIKVAEAAKVIENTQRDVNIAFINELSKIFHNLNIDTREVLDAAGSKWNFLKFNPGLVGGHCIGVDPFYLIQKAEQVGYQPNLLIESRNINDSMSKFIADNIIKYLISKEKNIKNSVVVIYGITFKKNVSDIRNSKVFDIIKELKDFGVTVVVKDSHADFNEVKEVYGIELENDSTMKADVVVFAVDHDEYSKIDIKTLKSYFKKEYCLFDIKRVFHKDELERSNFYYWSL